MTCPDLLAPARLWSRGEVLGTDCPVPRSPGVYAWYFQEVPALVPLTGCLHQDGKTLLYVGISPSAPPTNGKRPSSQSLWDRVRYHYRGNAEGSTLRLSLGCLLARELGIELRRVGSGKRLTFGGGEAALSEWMNLNAFVRFHVCSEPWRFEAGLICNVSLPLNLNQNRDHAFHTQLSILRKAAKGRAKELPILGPTVDKEGRTRPAPAG